MDARFVTLDDPMLGQRFYHELHFFCSECGDPFLDPSKSSAPGAGGTDDGETDPFVIHKGHPYCEKCHLRLHKPRCKKCTLPIPDVAVAAMGAKWHRECFVCAVSVACGQMAAETDLSSHADATFRMECSFQRTGWPFAPSAGNSQRSGSSYSPIMK